MKIITSRVSHVFPLVNESHITFLDLDVILSSPLADINHRLPGFCAISPYIPSRNDFKAFLPNEPICRSVMNEFPVKNECHLWWFIIVDCAVSGQIARLKVAGVERWRHIEHVALANGTYVRRSGSRPPRIACPISVRRPGRRSGPQDEDRQIRGQMHGKCAQIRV